ncbi:MAG: hypothetical protein IPO63_16380 [Bacteroidetes bacterium]|nr:hypothetical protein [Bacteroidota bacterium]
MIIKKINQCDNTYVLKIVDTGNNASIDRHGNFQTQMLDYNKSITRGYITHHSFEFETLLANHNISTFDIVDLSGRKIVNKGSRNNCSVFWNQLSVGCYFVRENNSSKKSSLFICK